MDEYIVALLLQNAHSLFLSELSFAMLEIWINTFLNLDKYILQFKQILLLLQNAHSLFLSELSFAMLEIWMNTFLNLDKYILQFGQIHSCSIATKCSLTFLIRASLCTSPLVIHFAIWKIYQNDKLEVCARTLPISTTTLHIGHKHRIALYVLAAGDVSCFFVIFRGISLP